ncbi:MAG: magnesium transporter, partial [Planctomycetota bacterium]
SLGAVIWKELRVGLFLAIALGIVAFALVAVYAEIMPNTADTPEWAGVAITVALVAHVVTAALLGAFIPLLVARLGRSPEVFSHPALNAVSDCVAVIIYLVTVTAILSTS